MLGLKFRIFFCVLDFVFVEGGVVRGVGVLFGGCGLVDDGVDGDD